MMIFALCTSCTQLTRSKHILVLVPKLISLKPEVTVTVTGPVDLIRSTGSSRVSHRDQIMITY